MKNIFVVYNQAYNMEVADLLEKHSCRGFTMWKDIEGRGSVSGEPHYGNHAWPTMNNALMAFVDDSVVDVLLQELRQMDKSAPALGLRAFVMPVEKSY